MKVLGSVTSPTKMPSEPSQATRPNPYVGLRDVLNKASGVHVLFLEGIVNQRACPARGARDHDNVRS